MKQKGARNAGSMQNVFAINSSDPGQIALIAAEQTRNNYPFKILWDAAPENGAIQYHNRAIESVGVITSDGYLVRRRTKAAFVVGSSDRQNVITSRPSGH